MKLNWKKLFEMQAALDRHIIEDKDLEGQDLLDKKILALQVELGELANEWEMFKFWKENPKPRYESVEIYVHGYEHAGQNVRASIEEYKRSPILEEYVDCLHFILSIGNDLGLADEIEDSFTNIGDMPLIGGFKAIYRQINDLSSEIDYGNSYDVAGNYEFLINDFIGLGEMLGFTRGQIEQAYLDKNEVNHTRQNTNY